MTEMACTTEDPELFFPTGNATPAILQIEEAKAVCARCLDRAECLAAALERSERWGIFGGKTEGERADMQDGLHPCESCDTRIRKASKRCQVCAKARQRAQIQESNAGRRYKYAAKKPKRRAAE
jgi:WhiB family redox-sensing transcriptional regulator